MSMQELLSGIIRALVDSPEEVQITQINEEDKVTMEIRVAKEDMGKVIGKQGRIAKAIRTVVKAATVNLDKRVFVDIVD